MIVSRSRANVLRLGSSSASRYASISFPGTSAILRRVPERHQAARTARGQPAHPRSRGLLFYRLLQQAVATDPHPYRELTTAASIDRYLWP